MSQVPSLLSQYGLTPEPLAGEEDNSSVLAQYGLSAEPTVTDAGPRQMTADDFFSRVERNPNKNWADRVMENVGPIGRGVGRGGQAVGDFVVNSVLRGVSYIPGAEGLSDKADHNNRVAELQRAYDMHLDETGTFAEVLGPTAARIAGSVGESGSDVLLTAGAGKLAKIKTPKGFVNWYAATQGARETERALTQATDSNITGPSRLVYAGARGALTALFTKGFGILGDKLGASTTPQLMAQGATRAIDKLFTRTGLKTELIGVALEAGENEGTAFSQALWDELNGLDSWDQYKEHFGESAIGGAVTRGLFGAGRRFQQSLAKTVAEMPDAVEGTLDAQAVKAGEKPEKKPKASDAYNAAYDAELQTLSELETEVNKRFEPIRQSQKEQEAKLQEAADFEKTISDLKKELSANRNVDSPEREKLSSDLARMSEELNKKFEELTKGEKTITMEEMKAKRDTNKDREYIESELKRLMGEQESRGDFSAVEELVGIKKELLERDRERYGLSKLPEVERKSFEEMLDRARQKNIPERARDIIADVIQNGTVMDDDTTAGVAIRYASVVEELEATRNAIRTAENPEQVTELLHKERELTQEVDFFTNGMARGGTEKGRSLVSQKILLASADDPTTALIRAKQRKVSSGGGTKKQKSLENSEGKLATKEKELQDKIATFGGRREGEPPSREEQMVLDELAKVHAELKAIQKAKMSTDLTPQERDAILDAAAKVRQAQEKRNQFDPGTIAFDDADFELHKARIHFESVQEATGRDGLANKALEANLIWKAIHTGFDLGAFGIQTGKVLLSNPILTAKNGIDMMKSLASEKQTFLIDREINQRANSDLYNKGYVTLLKETDPLSQREGLLASALFQKIPAVKNFERAFRTMVNKTRADLFDYRLELEGGRENLTEENLRGIGHAVDIFTGRGGRGYADQWAAQASLVAYAPRYTMAEIEFMLGRPLWKTDPATRKMVAKMYARTFAGIAWLYGAGAIANTIGELTGEGDMVQFEFDPASSNFGKIKIGNTWIDPTFKFARNVQMLANTATLFKNTMDGTDPTSLKIGSSRSGLFAKPGSKDEILKRRVLNYFRGKESLPLGVINDMAAGRHIDGRDVTWQTMINRYATPIAGGNIYKSMTSDYGVPEKAAQAILEAFGISAKTDFKKAEPLKIR